MRYSPQFLLVSLLFLPFNWSMGEDAISQLAAVQIEGQGDITVPVNKAVLEFEMNAVDVKTAKSKAFEAQGVLRRLLTKRDSIKVLTQPTASQENTLGFGTGKNGTSGAVSRLRITLQVPQRRAAFELGEKMNTVFGAMKARNAVRTDLVFDVSANVKAGVEKRAADLALKNAQGLAATIGKRMKAAPILKEMASPGGLSVVLPEEGFAKQPFFMTFRKSVVVIFNYIAKIPASALIKKAV